MWYNIYIIYYIYIDFMDDHHGIIIMGPWVSYSWMILNYMDDIWVMVHSDHSRQRCGRASGAVTVLWRCNCLGERFMWLTTKVDTVCDTVFFSAWLTRDVFAHVSVSLLEGLSRHSQVSGFEVWGLRDGMPLVLLKCCMKLASND